MLLELYTREADEEEEEESDLVQLNESHHKHYSKTTIELMEHEKYLSDIMDRQEIQKSKYHVGKNVDLNRAWKEIA